MIHVCSSSDVPKQRFCAGRRSGVRDITGSRLQLSNVSSREEVCRPSTFISARYIGGKSMMHAGDITALG
jgi:hypothetical protein